MTATATAKPARTSPVRPCAPPRRERNDDCGEQAALLAQHRRERRPTRGEEATFERLVHREHRSEAAEQMLDTARPREQNAHRLARQHARGDRRGHPCRGVTCRAMR